jgi:serine phosphatase RsbU (regulator of sigma subunit)
MRYVNAGHVPPLIFRENGEIESPVGGDVPVGMLEDSHYRERVIRLSPRDMILCVSDGITEVRNHKFEFWDESNIEAVLRKHPTGSLENLTRDLVSAADTWAGPSEQHDDMTVVALRITV